MRSPLIVALGFSLLCGLAYAENTDKEADEAIATFKKTYSSKEESDRISGIEALAATQSHKVVDALAPALKDKSSAVRRAAAKAIGGQWSQNAATTLLKALNPDDPAKDVTVAIINAL